MLGDVHADVDRHTLVSHCDDDTRRWDAGDSAILQCCILASLPAFLKRMRAFV
jgi:hypothetical protein